MFWSEPGKDVRVPVDPHTIGPYLQTCFGLSQVEIQDVPGDPHFVDLTFRHVLV